MIIPDAKVQKRFRLLYAFTMFFLRQLVSQIFMFPLLPNAVVNT